MYKTEHPFNDEVEGTNKHKKESGTNERGYSKTEGDKIRKEQEDEEDTKIGGRSRESQGV